MASVRYLKGILLLNFTLVALVLSNSGANSSNDFEPPSDLGVLRTLLLNKDHHRSFNNQSSWSHKNDDAQGELNLDEDDVRYIKRVLRMADFKETTLDSLIKHRHDLPSLERLINGVSGVLPHLRKALAGSTRSTNSGKSYEDLRKKSTLNSMQNALADSSKNYEDCVRDYAAYIEPLTNRLYNSLVRPALCAGITAAECNVLYPPQPETRMPAWGRYFLDAHGKLPEGLAEGKLYFVGGHDMCLEQAVVYNDTLGLEHEFNGLYCRISLTPNKFLAENSTAAISLLYGVCAPDTCTKEMLLDYIYNENIFLRFILDNALNMNITHVYCGQDLEPSTDGPFQVAIGVIISLVILIVIGTIYDGFFRMRIIRNHLKKRLEGNNTSPVQSLSAMLDDKIRWKHRLDLVLVSFSFYSNIYKIFGSATQPGDLRVLNGIKYLSFVWAILGNTYLLGPVYQESVVTSNLITALKTLPQNFLFQFVLNYQYNIDSFLVVSGVLVAWWWLRDFQEFGGKMTLRLGITMSLRHIAKKYWRLAPSLMFTVMFYTCLYRYFIDGPLYPQDITDADNCRVNWWVDLLMIHNLVRKSHMCLSWMFYVPLIFQIHVVALVALIPLVIWPIVGYIILGALFAANIGITAYVFEDLRFNEDSGSLFSEFLMAPWCRYGVYIIGMSVGIILHKTNRKIKIHPVLDFSGWLISIGTMAAIVFSTYSEFQEGGIPWSPAAQTAYDVISHPVWGLCIGWMILSTATGHGGVMAKFLQWNTFRALSRLVYMSLLTSSILILRYVYSSRVLLYIDMYHIGYLFLGHLIYLVAVGLIFALLWHYTISIGLENAVACKTMTNWLKSGRYPPELTKTLEKVASSKRD